MGYSGLFEVIDAHRHRTFVWGRDDCCLFAARCYDALHGTQIEAALLAEYCDEDSAKRFLVSRGGLVEAVSSYIGQPSKERAVRGDVVSVDGGEGEALGICMGSKVICLGPTGLRHLPRSAILKAWKHV